MTDPEPIPIPTNPTEGPAYYRRMLRIVAGIIDPGSLRVGVEQSRPARIWIGPWGGEPLGEDGQGNMLSISPNGVDVMTEITNDITDMKFTTKEPHNG